MDDPSSETLIADVRIRGVWQSQVDALFDVRVFDTDALSYLSRLPQAVLRTAEVEKRRNYGAVCLARRAIFYPRCFSVDGLFGTGAENFCAGLQILYQLNGKRIIVLCDGICEGTIIYLFIYLLISKHPTGFLR